MAAAEIHQERREEWNEENLPRLPANGSTRVAHVTPSLAHLSDNQGVVFAKLSKADPFGIRHGSSLHVFRKIVILETHAVPRHLPPFSCTRSRGIER